jgi:hypothetical protein
MLGFAGSSYALFALVWALFCLVAGALVTDTLLRQAPAPRGTEPPDAVP